MRAVSIRTLLLASIVAASLSGCGGGGGASGGSASAAPTIKSQPTSKTASVGSSVTFTVSASGASSYQWYKDGTAITGATSATLTIGSVTTADTGSYTVVVTNAIGTTTSEAVTLTLAAAGAPTITKQPTSITVAAGNSASLSVVATGSALTYQWYKDDAAISGATSAAYTVDAVSASDAGRYFVRVTNASSSVDSSSATLSLASSSAPKITTQPTSKTVSVGGTAAFSVTATGTSPLTYQWSKDGIAISGATGATLTISSATTASVGSYTVTVTNAAGSVTSSAATLTVTSAPAITTQPTSKTVNAGSSVTFTVGASGTGLTYQWHRSGGSTINTTVPSLTLTASTANAGTYYVVVKNSAGTAASETFTLTVISVPTITTQPTSLTVGLGSTASFTVAAEGGGTLAYQWYKDGAAISGATSATYTISAAATSDVASYKVKVSNEAGGATSSAATLTVDQPPTITSQPTSLTVNTGSSASFSVAATASGTLTYQWYKNGVLISGATSSSYSFSSVTSSDAGSYKVVVTNDGIVSTTSNVVTLTVR